MLRLKFDAYGALIDRGYTPTKMKELKELPQSVLYNLKGGTVPGPITLDKLCRLLQLQPGDLIEYIPDNE